MIKVGVFVTEAYYKKSDLYGVSGHVQIPLKAAVLLTESNNLKVDLITTKPDGCEYLMIDTPESLNIQLVEHATRKWPLDGVDKVKAAVQLWQLIMLFRKKSYDLVHFFGGPKTGLLAALTKLLFPRIKFVYSPISEPTQIVSNKLLFLMFRKLDLVLSTTEYVSNRWSIIVGKKKSGFIRPGILKNIKPVQDGGIKNSVLFWRNADFENGADIMIDIVEKISRAYPHIKFTFAIRPGSQFQQKIESLPAEFSNVVVFVYPYPLGVDIQSLLKDAKMVIAPYRKLSINPQMSILETLYAGVPVVASNIESNYEIVQDGITGMLVNGSNVDEYCYIIEQLLNSDNDLANLSINAYKISSERFNWQSFAANLNDQYSSLLRK
jgi:glycosyltransferase involved in cell wall biosynthesis